MVFAKMVFIWLLTVLLGSSVMLLAEIIFSLDLQTFDIIKTVEQAQIIVFPLFYSLLLSIPTLLICIATYVNVAKNDDLSKGEKIKKVLGIQMVCAVATFILAWGIFGFNDKGYLIGCFFSYTPIGLLLWRKLLTKELSVAEVK